MSHAIVTIVEGYGEIEAASHLIRRVLHEHFEEYGLQVSRPKRLKRQRIKKDLPRMLQHAANEKGCRAIIVLVDSDKNCAQELASKMALIASRLNIQLPVAIVCPNSEYETWFIASIDTIRGKSIGRRRALIDPEAACPENVECIGGAKEWLQSRMLGGMSYKPTQDQAPFTERIDLQLAAKRSRSFRRLFHAIEEILQGMRLGETRVTPAVTQPT